MVEPQALGVDQVAAEDIERHGQARVDADIRADAVLGGGGYVAGPAGLAALSLRIPLALVGTYATASFAHAVLVRTPFVALLDGHGVPGMLPWWLQGTWIGAFLLLPLAFFRELGAAIARLAMFPDLRWMVIFAMGCWIALNGMQ